MYRHCESFGGLPVRVFAPDDEELGEPSAFAWRVEEAGYPAPVGGFEGKLAALAERGGDAVRSLVLGTWGFADGNAFPLEALLDVAPRLTGLRALFLADLTPEESEISWIEHDDITPLFAAFPALEALRVRGSVLLSPVAHPALTELAFESGGLPSETVRALGDCDLPALRHLELWLGVPEYGGDTEVDDLAGVLEGGLLPALENLGLCNSPVSDALAAAAVDAPITAQLDVLDLSLGTLGDTGAEALIAGRAKLAHLQRLDLHHHWITPEARARLVAALPGVEVDLSEFIRPGLYERKDRRYTAVSE
ncbi:hypothetical protein Val02_00750 [Virgisporangium aliadipatigenens]|uniref:Cytoplasmic protein n=1 Tax=Virgisporangium aliadipatigenens TaxID=741659 RepID=A0A8J3YDP1_9ACTN|nr:hypothetical protein Val02_00750 [Virgisporangium aliadipatigenens]